MLIFLLTGCLPPKYTPTSSQILIPPGMYTTDPANKDVYCEEALIYAEGFTLNSAQGVLVTWGPCR